jgi:hypothetical protein
MEDFEKRRSNFQNDDAPALVSGVSEPSARSFEIVFLEY